MLAVLSSNPSNNSHTHSSPRLIINSNSMDISNPLDHLPICKPGCTLSRQVHRILQVLACPGQVWRTHLLLYEDTIPVGRITYTVSKYSKVADILLQCSSSTIASPVSRAPLTPQTRATPRTDEMLLILLWHQWRCSGMRLAKPWLV